MSKPPRHPRNANPGAYRPSGSGRARTPRGCWPRKTLLIASVGMVLAVVVAS